MVKLFNNNRSIKNYHSYLIEQYKLYHSTIERISDRRQQANNYFITINTLFISFIGIISKETKLIDSLSWLAFLAFIGIIICRSWHRTIASYKSVNNAKFKVIHEIEAMLPMNLFEYEWTLMERGENKKVFSTFSKIELHVPVIFAFLYFVLMILFLCLNYSDLLMDLFQLINLPRKL